MSMWNAKRSVLLSLIVTYIFAAALLVMIGAAPWLFSSYVRIAHRPSSVSNTLTITFYCCVPAAIAALYALLRLLYNIRSNKVFVPQNIFCLRLLSWCCFTVSFICLVACFFYFPFAIIFAAALFFALILRVIKNVFVCAAQLKEENDLTI